MSATDQNTPVTTWRGIKKTEINIHETGSKSVRIEIKTISQNMDTVCNQNAHVFEMRFVLLS